MEAAAAMQVVAVGERHRVIVDVMQLVVHVTDGVEVDAGGDERHHRKHQHGQRVDVVADGDLQLAELTQRVPVADDGLDRGFGVMSAAVGRRGVLLALGRMFLVLGVASFVLFFLRVLNFTLGMSISSMCRRRFVMFDRAGQLVIRQPHEEQRE